jgi:hypothetical protein
MTTVALSTLPLRILTTFRVSGGASGLPRTARFFTLSVRSECSCR